MKVVATVVWNGHEQWSFVVTTHVLTVWSHTGEAEPKKMYAWDLLDTNNLRHFLNTLLQKFHMTPKQNLSEVVTTLIIVINQFTLAAIAKEQEANELP